MKIPLEDRLEMMDVLARYHWYADMGQTDEFLELFTPDGVLEVIMPGTTEPWSPEGFTKHFAGREGIRKYMKGSSPEVFGLPNTHQLHHQSNFVIDEITGATAKSRNYMMHTVQMSPPDVRDYTGPMILTHGYYLDNWEKFEGRWCFKLRSYRPAGYHPSYFPAGYRPYEYRPASQALRKD